MYAACFIFSSEIPVIPDLDDYQEEDLANKIAAPPRLVDALQLRISQMPLVYIYCFTNDVIWKISLQCTSQ